MSRMYNLNVDETDRPFFDDLFGEISYSNIPIPTTIPDALPPLQRAVALAVLNNTLDKLYILRHIFDEPADSQWNQIVEYIPIDKRMAFCKHHYELEGYFHYTDVHKFLKDLCFISKILLSVSNEIADHGTYKCLKKILGDEEQTIIDEEKLIQDCKFRRRHINVLKSSLIKEKRQNLKALNEKVKALHDAREELALIGVHNKLEENYLTMWEQTRNEQNSLKHKLVEDELRNKINDFKTKIELENRAHNEIESFLVESKEDYAQDVEDWIVRYDRELEEFESNELQMNIKLEQLEARRTILTTVYERRKNDIAEWLVKKEEIRLEKEYNERRRDAAIRIQTWWRGVMVRKKLGKYRKKGKGKGKGKDKNKKGKKKK